MGLTFSALLSKKESQPSRVPFNIVRDDLYATNPAVVTYFEKLDRCIADAGVQFTGNEPDQQDHQEYHKLADGWKDRATLTDMQTATDECPKGGDVQKIIYEVYKLAEEDASQSMHVFVRPESLVDYLTWDTSMHVQLGAHRVDPNDVLPHTMVPNFYKFVDNEKEDMVGEFSDISDSDEEGEEVYAVYSFNEITGETSSVQYHSSEWTPRKVDSLWHVYSRWYTLKNMSNGMWTSPDIKYNDFRHTLKDLDLAEALVPVKIVYL